MVCKNCGEKLRSNERFCTVCGYYNDGEDDSLENDELGKNARGPSDSFFKMKKKSKNDEEQMVDTSYRIAEDSLMEAYIGEDYKWVMERPFNVYALIFSWMYFLYRKLYLIGVIGLAITGIILKFAPIIIVPYIILSMVGSGLFFNKIYIKLVERKVESIERKSPGLDSYSLERKCKRRGGVTVVVPLVIFLIFLVIMIFSFLNIQYTEETPDFWKENNENQANCKSMGKQAYKTLSKYNIAGTLEEVACEVEISSRKSYNIYLKVQEKAQYHYIFFANDQEGYITLKGNTEIIKELEVTQKTYGLSESDEEFLQTSKELANKFASLKDDEAYEAKQIKEKTNTREKTHFVFTKDDILN